MHSPKLLLCLLLVLLPVLGVHSSVPIPEPARQAWDEVLNAAWLKAKPRVAFCLGEGRAGVLKTMLESFPDPLPTEPANDPVCSNATRLGRHLCGPKSLMEYYKVMSTTSHRLSMVTVPLSLAPASEICLQYLLLTDNDEKVPNTAACPVGVSTPQCSPGKLLWTSCLVESNNRYIFGMHYHNPHSLQASLMKPTSQNYCQTLQHFLTLAVLVTSVPQY